jgi:hypothetical protein
LFSTGNPYFLFSEKEKVSKEKRFRDLTVDLSPIFDARTQPRLTAINASGQTKCFTFGTIKYNLTLKCSVSQNVHHQKYKK